MSESYNGENNTAVVVSPMFSLKAIDTNILSIQYGITNSCVARYNNQEALFVADTYNIYRSFNGITWKKIYTFSPCYNRNNNTNTYVDGLEVLNDRLYIHYFSFNTTTSGSSTTYNNTTSSDGFITNIFDNNVDATNVFTTAMRRGIYMYALNEYIFDIYSTTLKVHSYDALNFKVLTLPSSLVGNICHNNNLCFMCASNAIIILNTTDWSFNKITTPITFKMIAYSKDLGILVGWSNENSSKLYVSGDNGNTWINRNKIMPTSVINMTYSESLKGFFIGLNSSNIGTSKPNIYFTRDFDNFTPIYNPNDFSSYPMFILYSEKLNQLIEPNYTGDDFEKIGILQF